MNLKGNSDKQMNFIYHKPTLVIVEMFWHHDLLKTFCEIGEFIKSDDITIITSSPVIEKIEYACKKFKKIVFPPSYRHIWANEKLKIVNLPKLIIKLKEEGDKLLDTIKKLDPDIILIDTLTEPPFYEPLIRWGKAAGKKIIVIIHNAHFWNLKWFMQTLDWRMIQERKFVDLAYNLYVANKIDAFVILGEYIKVPPLLRKKPYIILPSRCGSEIKPLKPKNIVYFVISGKITQRYGKDFLYIIDSFYKIIKKHPELKGKVKLILLGRLIDEVISRKLNEIDPKSEIIERFRGFVDEKTFEEWLIKSHFAIVPPTKNKTYGTFKISGSINDAFSFGVPLLLPENYAPHYKFGNYVIRYSLHDFSQILYNCAKCVLTDYKKYENLLNASTEIMMKNTPRNAARKFEDFLAKL